jgi:hypothetical protein
VVNHGLDETSLGIISIFDLNSQVHYCKEVYGLKTFSFDCSGMSQGIYLVEYRTENFKIVKKWIKL